MLAEPETIDCLCDFICDGGMLASWCREKDIKYRVVQGWLDEDAERREKFNIAIKSRNSVVVDDVTDALRGIAAVDPRAAFDEKGHLLPITKMPDGIARSIAGIDVIAGPRGESTTKIRFDSRLKTLEMLGRSVSMFKDGVELTGKGGGPVEVRRAEELSDEELATIIATGALKK